MDVEKKDSYGKTWSSGHGLERQGLVDEKGHCMSASATTLWCVFSIVILVYFQFWEGMGVWDSKIQVGQDAFIQRAIVIHEFFSLLLQVHHLWLEVLHLLLVAILNDERCSATYMKRLHDINDVEGFKVGLHVD